jgi:hypothetical protein
MKLLYILLFTLFTGTVFSQHFSEDFSSFPNGWTIQSGASSTASGVALWHGDSTANDTSAVIAKIDDYVVHDEWLISPCFFVPISPKTLLQFDFKASNFWMITPFDSADLVVHITVDSGLTWVPIWNEDSVHFDSYQWTTDYIDISAFQNDTIQIGYQYKGRKGNSVNIDNVVVRDADSLELVITNAYYWFQNDSNRFEFYRYSYYNLDTIVYTIDVKNVGYSQIDSIFSIVNISNGPWPVQAYTLSTSPGFSSMNSMSFDIVGSDINIFNSTLQISYEVYYDFLNSNFAKTIDSLDNTHDDDVYYHKGSESIHGFFGEIDYDEDGFPDPYQVFSGVSWSENAETFDGLGSVVGDGSIGEIIEHEVYIEDPSGALIPTFTTWGGGFTMNSASISTLSNVHWLLDFNSGYQCDFTSLSCVDHLFLMAGGFSPDIAYSKRAHNVQSYITFNNTSSASVIKIPLLESPLIRISKHIESVDEVEENQFSLSVHPNPSNSETTVTFSNKFSGNMKLSLTDIDGKTIRRIDFGFLEAGAQSFPLDVSNLANGLYLYTVQLDNQSVTGKIIVSH